MPKPHFRHEKPHIASGQIVCGIDEAGRGPWAGPVVAAAVVLDPKRIPKGLNDSKKLTAEKREALFDVIMCDAQVGVGIVEADVIDTINILQATYRAMTTAVAQLHPAPHVALVDGNRAPPLSIRVQTIIGGDAASVSIAAASIIAKVTRDRIMHQLDSEFPHYGFSQHKGYGTAFHAEALAKHGPCPQHRKSFNPVSQLELPLTNL
jgi:ribonuclease HII